MKNCPMKSARFLVMALLPLMAACVASVPTYVWKPFANPAAAIAGGWGRAPEKTFRVSGYVLDAVSCRPVVGVVVGGLDFGRFSKQPRTDSTGYFVLRLPASRWNVGSRLGVETVFYEGSTIIPTDTMQAVTILMKRSAYRMKGNSCQHAIDTLQPPPYSAVPILGLPGTQYALLICDSLFRQPHKLRAITFKLGSQDAFPIESFRIRIYHYYGQPDAPPGDDLLVESITVCPENKAGIYTFDVSPYDMVVSGKGVFLALEYVVGGDKFYCNDTLAHYTPIGPVLRPPCARPNIRTWEYTIGKGWHRATAAENCWPLYESALSVEVEPAPAKH